MEWCSICRPQVAQLFDGTGSMIRKQALELSVRTKRGHPASVQKIAAADAYGKESSNIAVDEIEADPERLAQEVQQIKANQQLVMKTLTEAKPGVTTSPGMDDFVETAAKGAGGSLASAGAGAAIGTLIGGPVGTTVGAGVGAVAGMASDLTKLGVDYAADRVTGNAQQLDQMYSEMTKMYKEMKEGSQHGGKDPFTRGD